MPLVPLHRNAAHQHDVAEVNFIAFLVKFGLLQEAYVAKELVLIVVVI